MTFFDVFLCYYIAFAVLNNLSCPKMSEAAYLLRQMDNAKRQRYKARMYRQMVRNRRGLAKVLPARGSRESVALFGKTYAEAEPMQKYLRRLARFRGNGGYWGRGIGGLIGGAFGHAGAGAAIGDKVGDWVSSKFTGRGDYVNTNDIVHVPEQAGQLSIPSFGENVETEGGIVISHKEYLQDVVVPAIVAPATAPVPFSLVSYPINPGLETSFPWLAQVAANYEEYELKQCIFTFRSTTTDIGTTGNGQCGTIVMATNYNAGAPLFSDKRTIMEYANAMSCKTTEHMEHGVECDPKLLSGADGKYVRTGPVPAGQDAKTYDHAMFQLALCNQPAGFAAQSVGELWVSYTVVLRKPKLVSATGSNISRDYFVQRVPISYNYPLSASASALGSSFLSAQQNSIGCVVAHRSAGGFTVTFPSGFSGTVAVKMSCLATASGTITNTGVNPWATSGNLVPVSDIQGTDDGWYSYVHWDAPSGTVGITQAYSEAHFRVALPAGGVSNVLTFTTPITSTAVPSNCSLEIVEYNAAFNYAQNGTNDAIVLVNPSGVVTY